MTAANHYFVYVIRLSTDALQRKKFRDENPQYIEGFDCFYVGMTGRTPALRFEQHKNGYKACGLAKDFGVELMPQSYGCINPRTYVEAQKLERRVAKRLRRRGFAVWQR
jgi:hypothetical protein